MKFTNFVVMSVMIMALTAGTAGAKSATFTSDLITFDDLIGGSDSGVLPPLVPSPHHGLNWDNFYVVAPAGYGAYGNGLKSGPNVAVVNTQVGDDQGIMSDGLFILNSLWLTSGWNDSLGITIEGFRSGNKIYELPLNLIGNHNIYLSTSVPKKVTLDWWNIDQVKFTLADVGSGNMANFIVDDILINTVPVPAAAWSGLALMGVLGFARKCRK